MTLPTDYSGLQMWVDTSQHSATNADPVDTATNYSGSGAGNYTQTLTLRPTYRTSIFPLGGAAFDFDGTDDYMEGPALSVITTASAYTVFGVVLVDSVASNSANTYSNDAIWGENQGYAGTFLKSTGPTICSYNWDGSDDHADNTFTAGTAFVFMQRHEGGNLYISKDGGTEASVASGDTSVLTGPTRLGRGSAAAYLNGKLGEFIVYNVALTTGEIAALNTYLATKWISAGAPASAAPKSLVMSQAVRRASLR